VAQASQTQPERKRTAKHFVWKAETAVPTPPPIKPAAIPERTLREIWRDKIDGLRWKNRRYYWEKRQSFRNTCTL
jgi:hypothetical protein